MENKTYSFQEADGNKWSQKKTQVETGDRSHSLLREKLPGPIDLGMQSMFSLQ